MKKDKQHSHPGKFKVYPGKTSLMAAKPGFQLSPGTEWPAVRRSWLLRNSQEQLEQAFPHMGSKMSFDCPSPMSWSATSSVDEKHKEHRTEECSPCRIKIGKKLTFHSQRHFSIFQKLYTVTTIGVWCQIHSENSLGFAMWKPCYFEQVNEASRD